MESIRNLMELDRNDLIKKVQQGDSPAFGQLVWSYGKSLLDLAYGITGNLEDAKDVTQETYIKALKYLGSYNSDKSFKNWIYKININLCLDLLRKRKKQFRSKELTYNDQIFVPSGGNPTSLDFMDSLMKCLRILNPKERIVFILRDMEGMSIKESAQILRSSQGMVKYRLSKARKNLKDKIVELHPQLEEK